MNDIYASKEGRYFAHARVDIAPLLPRQFHSVLEIGCGAGATLAWLRETYRCDRVAGMELSDRVADTARTHAHDVVTGNAEDLIDTSFDGEQFDLVLCLDVLEHMVDPWHFVAKLGRVVNPAGTVIFSVPNVRHFRVSFPLLFAGNWRYVDEGVLDRTHLRFFTRESALELASISPFEVVQWRHNLPPPTSKVGLANKLTLGLLADFLASQFLISARVATKRLPAQ